MSSSPSTETVWQAFRGDLWRFFRRRVPDDPTADDLLQDTFVRVHRNLNKVSEADRLAGWVYQIARNVVRDYYRKTAKGIDPTPEAEPAADAAAEPACRPAEWLGEFVRALPPGYREAVQLSEVEEWTQGETATRLGLSLSGAKSRIQRGRAMLKEMLEQCCKFEFDRRGRVIDCEPKGDQPSCSSCAES